MTILQSTPTQITNNNYNWFDNLTDKDRLLISLKLGSKTKMKVSEAKTSEDLFFLLQVIIVNGKFKPMLSTGNRKLAFKPNGELGLLITQRYCSMYGTADRQIMI